MDAKAATAEERRQAAQVQAADIGIDEAYIDLLVETFYARVREDELLGPVFDGAIGDGWPAHLAKLKAFWSSVALASGRYSGRPVPKHMALTGIEPEHFDRWLGLFARTLADTAPSDAAARFFMVRAERIGASLKLALFGLPELAAMVRPANAG